jgi:hypothetical protein
MTPLERETLAEGFTVCLLGAQVCRKLGRMEYHATLFDGGRRVQTAHHQGSYPPSSDKPFEALRACLLAVAQPPHVLAVYGSGWRDLLAEILPSYVPPELRILDLLTTAVALRGTLPARASVDRIRQAYGLGPAPDTESVTSPVYEDILWAVIAHAGGLGLDRPALLRAAREGVQRAPFERYAFDEAGLAAVPSAPGVYVMRDATGATLYVGKSANLARRLRDYFRPARELTPKLAAIRDRIRSFECRRVGSELEALLLENRLIAEHASGINVQRTVAEGASRYAFPLVPVVILCPSARKACVELFFSGAQGSALQYSLRLRRPAPAFLARLIRHCATGRARLPHSDRLTDWGIEGREICGRCFARFRDRLNWLELDLTRGIPALVRVLLDIAQRTGKQPFDPGEFRLKGSI